MVMRGPGGPGKAVEEADTPEISAWQHPSTSWWSAFPSWGILGGKDDRSRSIPVVLLLLRYGDRDDLMVEPGPTGWTRRDNSGTSLSRVAMMKSPNMFKVGQGKTRPGQGQDKPTSGPGTRARAAYRAGAFAMLCNRMYEEVGRRPEPPGAPEPEPPITHDLSPPAHTTLGPLAPPALCTSRNKLRCSSSRIPLPPSTRSDNLDFDFDFDFHVHVHVHVHVHFDSPVPVPLHCPSTPNSLRDFTRAELGRKARTALAVLPTTTHHTPTPPSRFQFTTLYYS
ncbi:hypothetical protein B7494_g1255 [Chlorociboria aeruginascens]|nr:hypothetical protein B7494_g1255 [Chlorociboria aeruginascens]